MTFYDVTEIYTGWTEHGTQIACTKNKNTRQRVNKWKNTRRRLRRRRLSAKFQRFIFIVL